MEHAPEQLELAIDQNTYNAFKQALFGTQEQPGPLLQETGGYRFDFVPALMAMWSSIHDVASTATWTKKLLLEHKNEPTSTIPGRLLLAFGCAHSASEVGALGQDLVESYRARFSDDQPWRDVLQRWADDDPDGPWDNLLPADEDEDEIDPELAEYFAVGKKLDNRIRGQLKTEELPGFFERVASIPFGLGLGVLESVQIGKLSVPVSPYNFFLSPALGGEGHILRAWHKDGLHTFSVEPTTGDDNWLVFMRFA